LLWQLEYADSGKAREYAAEMLDRDDSLLNFLYTFSHPDLANIGKARKRRGGYRSFAGEINRLVPISRVLERLGELDEHSLTWTQREFIRALREDARRMAENDAELQKNAGANESLQPEADDD
jgi:hypothetical protein